MKIENSIATPPAPNVLQGRTQSTAAPNTTVPGETIVQKIGHFRWTICALLFFGTTMNYVDREVLGLLAPELQTKIGWNEVQYGYIVTAFQGAYAIGLLLMGRLIDLIGTRVGYALSIGIWSMAAAAHAFARTPLGFGRRSICSWYW